MTDTTIRKMSPEEMLEVLFPLASYAFHPSPPFRERGDWDETILARKGVAYFALFEGDTAVATVASTQMTQQVRGEIYDAGGVWGVVTHPAARRKGYCKRLMARLLAADREEGRVLSCLYPFRESFYEKLSQCFHRSSGQVRPFRPISGTGTTWQPHHRCPQRLPPRCAALSGTEAECIV